MKKAARRQRPSEAKYLDRWEKESDGARRLEFKHLRRQIASRKRRGRVASPYLRKLSAATLKVAGSSRKELAQKLDADFEAARKDAARDIKGLRRLLPDRRRQRAVLRDILALRHRVSGKKAAQ